MLTPLVTFRDTAKALALKPLPFWGVKQRDKILDNNMKALVLLKEVLDGKKLQSTRWRRF
jgi:hypothetical protein